MSSDEISKRSFEDAIKEIRDVVGNDQGVLGNRLEEYVDPYELWENEGKRKCLAMQFGIQEIWQVRSHVADYGSSLASIEELRRLLAVANQLGIPVGTFSRGKNLGCMAQNS